MLGSLVGLIYTVALKELLTDSMARQALSSKHCVSPAKPLPAFMDDQYVAVFTNPLHILSLTHSLSLSFCHTHTHTH
jgi:hypothetical protein